MLWPSRFGQGDSHPALRSLAPWLLYQSHDCNLDRPLLEEEGALSLDAAVTTYLKVSCGACAHEGWDQVTLDHLMCHTGGVPGDLLDSIWGDLWRAPDGVTGRRLFVDWLLQRPPGKLGQYEYANGGYMLLGSVVAAVTGRCWEEVGASDNRGTLDMDSQRA